MPDNLIYIVLTGVLAGLLPGLFGFGGGWLLVPVLVLCLGLSWAYASGTVLCAIVAGSASGAMSLLLEQKDQKRHLTTRSERSVTGVMCFAALGGTLLGKAWLRDRLEHSEAATLVLDSVLLLVLLFIAGRMLLDVARKRRRGAPAQPTPSQLLGLALLTLIPGVLSGLTGIGGGILFAPMLLFMLNWREDDARAAARLVCLASAVAGAGLYARSGGVNFPVAAAMFIPAGIVGVAASSVRFGHLRNGKRLFNLLTAGLALAAGGLTVAHMTRESTPAVPAAEGSIGLALAAVLLPLAWGALCGAGTVLIAKLRGRRPRSR